MLNEEIPKKKYDLEERIAKFGENIIEFAKNIPKNMITIPLTRIGLSFIFYKRTSNIPPIRPNANPNASPTAPTTSSVCALTLGR